VTLEGSFPARGALCQSSYFERSGGVANPGVVRGPKLLHSTEFGFRIWSRCPNYSVRMDPLATGPPCWWQARGWDGRYIRGCEAAAPLKPAEARAATSAHRRHPRLRGRGPIEARLGRSLMSYRRERKEMQKKT